MSKREDLSLFFDMYEKDITIDNCYHFLGCSKEESLEEIRKKFYYKIHALTYYNVTLLKYYDKAGLLSAEKQLKRLRELKANHFNWRLVSESYLAILLDKSKKDSYQAMINGLSSTFSICGFTSSRIHPILEDEFYLNRREYVYEHAINYFEDLMFHVNHIGTGEGLYLHTSSLSSIILFEKELFKSSDKVKVLLPEKEIDYDHANIKFKNS